MVDSTTILQALQAVGIVRLPLNRIGELTRVNKVLTVEQRLGRPRSDEIADELEVSPVIWAQRLAQRPVSLEMPCDDLSPIEPTGI